MNLAAHIEERLQAELKPHLRAMAADVQAYVAQGWSPAARDPVIEGRPDGRHVATVVLELSRPDHRPAAQAERQRLRALGEPEAVPHETRNPEARFVFENGTWRRTARWLPPGRSYQDLD